MLVSLNRVFLVDPNFCDSDDGLFCVGVLDFGCVHVQLIRDFKFQLLPPDSRCFLAGGVAAREPRLVCCCDNSTIMTLKSPVSLGNLQRLCQNYWDIIESYILLVLQQQADQLTIDMFLLERRKSAAVPKNMVQYVSQSF